LGKSIVALVRCEEYAEGLVYEKVRRGIDLLGGIQSFVKPGEKIVLKPNVLIGIDPNRNVTTHPTVFKAVGRILKDFGAIVSYGDSPSHLGSVFNLRNCGLKAVGDELGFRIADFDHGQEVTHESALLHKKLLIANGILEADGVISLPKLKTHGLTRLTGCIKNQFGCIPGLNKRGFHFNMPDPYQFATMLVDINTFVKPRLFIMDGIMAMEGNGPFGGQSRPLKVLLFSTDPVALDSIVCKIIDLNPEFVPTSKPGERSGLGTYHYENIQVSGDELNSFMVKDFAVVRQPPVAATTGRLRKFFKDQLTPRPVIDQARCIKCGTCLKMCPLGSKALDWTTDKTGQKRPQHHYNQCIRCYCCQETCPEGAITIKTPFMGRFIFRK
jgi:uncharacterized protein (DUF362 family)/ferredoxin